MSDLQKKIRGRQGADEALELIAELAEAYSGDGELSFWSRIRDKATERLPKKESPTKSDHAMTDGQAAMFEKSLMPYGIHEGKPIAQVPLEYLDWLIGQQDDFKVQVRRYLANKRVSSLVSEECDDE